MDIVPIQPEHVERLHAIYIRQTANAPHCRLTPTLEQFGDDVLQRSARLRQMDQNFDVVVAETLDGATGFAALTTFRGKFDDGNAWERQAITGLFAADEAAAHALILACEQRATAADLMAFPGSHGNTIVQTYNAGWDGLSSRVGGIAPVLTQRGFLPYTGELHMTAPLDPVRLEARSLLAPLTMDGPRPSSSYPWSLVTRAMDGEKRIGLCSFSDLAPVAAQPHAREVGYIWGLGVDEGYRRQGIARALLVTAMRHLAEQGCRECWLTTTVDNWAAQPLYYSLGFEVVDTSFCFRKRMTRE